MIVNEIDMSEILSSSESKEAAQEKIMEIFMHKMENDNNYFAKTIATYIRVNIEDFHSKYLNDEQMKELNPLIRNAIFTFLEDFDNGRIDNIWGTRMINCPDYWEDCKYENAILGN